MVEACGVAGGEEEVPREARPKRVRIPARKVVRARMKAAGGDLWVRFWKYRIYERGRGVTAPEAMRRAWAKFLPELEAAEERMARAAREARAAEAMRDRMVAAAGVSAMGPDGAEAAMAAGAGEDGVESMAGLKKAYGVAEDREDGEEEEEEVLLDDSDGGHEAGGGSQKDVPRQLPRAVDVRLFRGQTCTDAEAVAWVKENINDPAPDLRTCPGVWAWTMLWWVRQKKANMDVFMARHVSEAVKRAVASTAGANPAEAEGHMRFLDEVRKMAEEASAGPVTT